MVFARHTGSLSLKSMLDNTDTICIYVLEMYYLYTFSVRDKYAMIEYH